MRRYTTLLLYGQFLPYSYQVGDYHSHNKVSKDERSNGNKHQEVDCTQYIVITLL